MSDEEEWWKENAEENYSNRLESMQEGLNRLWNEACYLTDEYKLNFSDVAMILEKTKQDIIELELIELGEEEGDYDDDDEGESWKD